MERLELEVRALEDTAQAWDVLSGLLADSAEQVRVIAASPEVGEWSVTGLWGEVLADVEEARLRTQEWADGLCAVLDDMAGVEASVVADLGAVLRRARGRR